MTPLRKGGAFRVLTERDPEALARAAPLCRARARDGGPSAAPRREDRLRPAIEDGFYYDFEVASPFTPDDLDAFEKEMRKVVAGEVSVRA